MFKTDEFKSIKTQSLSLTYDTGQQYQISYVLNLLISNFGPPRTQTFRCLIVVGVLWGVFSFEIFLCQNVVYFFFFFLKSFKLSGGTILIFFHDQQPKNRARRSTMDPKIDTFWPD